jgi:hypothetical protein
MNLGNRSRSARRFTTLIGVATLVTGFSAAVATSPVHAAPISRAVSTGTAASGCQLGNGVKHVVQITFDNVHFFQDNPNVPSDLQLMPNLLNFFENNGTFLSNNHTPLIAHTADDILTTYTGLYGDRQGMGISNSYRVYQASGTTDSASSFAYWTDPIFDTSPTATDTNPSLVYSPVPPATAKNPVSPTTTTPAPWVPFTRAGCDVGNVATPADSEIENTAVDLPKVFGAGSPEVQQLVNDKDKFKDQEAADYTGIAVHCAQGSTFCADATAVKYPGTGSPTSTAVADSLPDEPGGYTGYQALFGHRYVAPELGAGTDNATHDGYAVTNAAGNLVDLNGNQINGDFESTPGFPGYGPINASQTLAYAADMLESGIPVVDAYISDVHGNEFINDPTVSAACAGVGNNALGSGSACYVAQAAYYNQAFGTFFQRLAADGITPQNTLFVLSPDEEDHQAGANVGRAIQPTPANCDGSPANLCTYPAGTFGELGGDITGLLNEETGDTTPFGVENDTAPEFYVNGQPSASSPQVRTFEHDIASLTADNPYAGGTQKIANYLADPTEMAILHMVDADPARTPTLAEFAKPDYFLQSGPATCNATVTGSKASDYPGDCVSVNPGFAWDHGDYAAEINTTYVGFAGPGVRHLGLDGSGPGDGPTSSGANSGQTEVVDLNLKGPWTDETDIQPTEMYLLGLHTDYIQDGRVITQVLTDPNHALRNPLAAQLGEAYKQLNSSVGQFGAYTLTASTNAIESSTPGDVKFLAVSAALKVLDQQRDALANTIKTELYNAENNGTEMPAAGALLVRAKLLIVAAGILAAHS